MVGLNKIIVIGNLGTDPEMRYTANGNAVTSFNLATSRSYTSADGERKQDTEWFRVVTWNQLAETVNQYLSKGRRAYVEGRLHSDRWDGQDGQTRFSNEIIANTILFLDRPGSDPSGASEGDSDLGNDPGISEPSLDPEELPF